MTDLPELADRVEKATGTDDELDLAIAQYGYHHRLFGINYDAKLWLDRRGWSPTGSLDDAMSLVPEPGKWSITASSKDDGWEAAVWLTDGAGLDWRNAATPALALTAAALRARHAMKGEG